MSVSEIRISAEGRTAIRNAITSHPDWNAYRKGNNLSLATMSRADYLAAATVFGINVPALLADLPAVEKSPRAEKAADVFDNEPAPVVSTRIAEPRRTVENARTAIEHDDALRDAPRDDARNDKMGRFLAMLSELTETSVDESEVRRIVKAELDAALINHVPTLKIELQRDGVKVADLKGRHHPKFAPLLKVLTAIGADGYAPNVWIAGPAGSGKTTAARNCAKALDIPFHFNGAIGMTHELLGFIDAGGTYHRTPFRDAYEHGGVYLFDEVDGSDNSALLALNAALANGIATFPDMVVPRHDDCRVIAAANTWGFGGTADYVGRAKIDGAFLDRFPVRFHWDYDESLERDISGDVTFAGMVQAARRKARDAGLKVLITPRATMAGAALCAAGFSRKEAADMTYLANLSDAQRAIVDG
jgi:cobaltochelatase CobS